MDRLIASQGFLGPLAADPSVRGVMGTLDLALAGVRRGETTLAKLARPLAELADALERVTQGKPAFFSWRTLIADRAPETRETRRFILVRPKLDYAALAPGARASRTIRAAALALGLSPENGVRVRLTGQVQLEGEEFATLTQHLWLMTFGTLGARIGHAVACRPLASHHRLHRDHDRRRPARDGGPRSSRRRTIQRDLGRLRSPLRRAGHRLRHPVQRALPCRAPRPSGLAGRLDCRRIDGRAARWRLQPAPLRSASAPFCRHPTWGPRSSA